MKFTAFTHSLGLLHDLSNGVNTNLGRPETAGNMV